MYAILLFMITLILCSCEPDVNNPFNNDREAQSYAQFMEDYDPPRYKWGYIDKYGSLEVKDKFDDCREFSEGRAAVIINGLWGYIFTSGEFAVTPRYRAVYEYSEGLGLVRTFDNKYLFIDKQGDAVTDTLDYSNVQSFNSGLARVNSGSLYGYLDKNGNESIELKFSKATNFKNGFALVTESGLSKLIDTSGKQVFTIKGDVKYYFPQDNMIKYKVGEYYGYAPTDARSHLISAKFISASNFHEGKAIVFDGIKYYLINKRGQTIPLPYTKVTEGGEGKWIYKQQNKFGYLKNDGSPLTTANFDMATRFKDNMAAIMIGENWGYVDSSGHLAIPPSLPLAWDFKNGRARMIDRYGYGFIDKKGEFIITPRYFEVRDFSEGLARVQVYRQ